MTITRPHAWQISWHSLTGHAAFRLQKSCLGNELDSTAKKIQAYVPRIFVALPILLICASLDFAAALLKLTGFLLLTPVACCFPLPMRTHWAQLLCDFISIIALPIILPGHLLVGKIPTSARPGFSIWQEKSYLSERWLDAFPANQREQITTWGPIVMQVAGSGMAYTLDRMLDSLGQENRKAILERIDALHLEYDVKQPVVTVKGSLLVYALYSQSPECVDLLIRTGAKLSAGEGLSNEIVQQSRLNALYYACQGPAEILEQITTLEDFNPTEIFTISRTQLREWIWWENSSAVRPTPRNYEHLRDLSLVELALFSRNTKALKPLQSAGATINYFELSQLKYFLEHPETDPNTLLSTQFTQKDNKWTFVTTVATANPREEALDVDEGEEKEETAKSSISATERLSHNRYYRVWQQCPRPSRSWGKMQNETALQNLTEILQYQETAMGLMEPFFPTNGHVASIVASYL